MDHLFMVGRGMHSSQSTAAAVPEEITPRRAQIEILSVPISTEDYPAFSCVCFSELQI